MIFARTGVRLAAASLLLSSMAMAEHGAVSADLGAGLDGMFVPTPYVEGGKSTAGAVPAVTAGARYALKNWLEVSASGFFAFPNTYWHNGGAIVTGNGSLPGSLSHQLMTYGATVGARVTKGEELRFVLGCELGWVHRSYSQFTAWNDADPSNVAPYPLSPPLADIGIDNVLLAPMVGIEWAAGDHYSFSVLPRLQLLLGSQTTVGVMLPLTLSWSWYL